MEASYLKKDRCSGVLQDYGGEEQRAGLGAWLQGGQMGRGKKTKDTYKIKNR